MSCGMSFIKYLLFLFNLVFALTGLALLVLGVIIQTETKVYNDFLAGKFSAPPILLIVVGSIVFIVAFYGCCGAIRESHCMIVTFAVFLLTIFIIEIIVGALAFVYSNDTEDVLVDELNKVVQKYYGDKEAAAAMDTIQEALKCCGYSGPEDYYKMTGYPGTLPQSCCVKGQSVCRYVDDDKVHFTLGCQEALKQFVHDSGIILGAVAIGVAFVELVGIIFALCLANSIKNRQRRGI